MSAVQGQKVKGQVYKITKISSAKTPQLGNWQLVEIILSCADGDVRILTVS